MTPRIPIKPRPVAARKPTTRSAAQSAGQCQPRANIWIAVENKPPVRFRLSKSTPFRGGPDGIAMGYMIPWPFSFPMPENEPLPVKIKYVAFENVVRYHTEYTAWKDVYTVPVVLVHPDNLMHPVWDKTLSQWTWPDNDEYDIDEENDPS